MLNKSMILDQETLKPAITWVTSLSMVVFNKVTTYDVVMDRVIDVLTIVSLVVAISYTVYRWRKLLKRGK